MSLFLLYFFHVAIRKCKMTYVTRIIFLLDRVLLRLDWNTGLLTLMLIWNGVGGIGWIGVSQRQGDRLGGYCTRHTGVRAVGAHC